MSEIKVMWGDPPKPFLWKVESMPYMRKKEGVEYFVVSSPLLKYTLEVKLIKGTYSSFSLHLVGTNAFYYINVQNGSELRQSELRKLAFGEAYWGEVNLFLKKQGAFKDPTVKVGSNEKKVMWGEPPKPYLWKAREPFKDLVEVTSPLMVGAIELQFRSYADYILISYYPRDTADAKVVLGTADAWDDYTTESFYKKHIARHIKSGEIQMVGNTKVASSPLKFMWGDPPKPYLWKAERTDFKESYKRSRIYVTSPLMEGRIIIYLTEQGAKAIPVYNTGKMGADPDNEHYNNMRLSVDDLPLFYIQTQEFYLKHIVPFIEKGRIKMKGGGVKLASNGIKLMWGDPPKPFLWEAELIDQLGRLSIYEVNSPLLKSHLILEVDHTLCRTMGEGLVKVVRGGDKASYFFTKTFTGEDLTKQAFSPETWKRLIKPFVMKHGLAKGNVKLASDNIKVMWGDPPKPFLWKAEPVRSNISYTDNFRVSSPLLKREIELSINSSTCMILAKGEVRVRVMDSNVMSEFYVNAPDGVTLAKRVFSPSVWGSHIKPFLIESDNLKAGVKVASNKIKVMWGNPPKPYLWSVVPCMYDTKFADGCYKITSPILKVVIFLDVFSNDRGYVMRVRVEGVNDHHFLVLRTHKSIPDLVAYFAGADFWSKYLYPFIEENGYLKVGKLS